MSPLYRAMQSAESKVAGGEGTEGIYGSITEAGHRFVLASMPCLDAQSKLLDIGCGLGRPLVHAAVEFDVRQTYGIEVDALKIQKLKRFLKLVHAKVEIPGYPSHPRLLNAGVESVRHLPPVTHAYAAWEGFPDKIKERVGRLCRATETLQCIAIVQKSIRADPCEQMREWGFGAMRLVASGEVRMTGSGRQLRAYVFVKA